MPEHSDDFNAFLIRPEHSEAISIERVHAWSPQQGGLWIHLNRGSDHNRAWIAERAGLDQHVVDALLSGGTRPRTDVMENGLILTLRGVNLNEGADPADMVSLRIWIDSERLITIEREKLMSVAQISERVRRDEGPGSIGALLVRLIEALTAKAGPIIDGITARLDELEDLVIGPETLDDRAELLNMRQQVVKMYRYLKPQAEALHELRELKLDAIDMNHQHLLAEVHNRITRYVEDLDASKSRLVLIQEELTNQYAEQLNDRLYTVTLVATILLPLSLLTGILGINVGGMPGTDSPYAFSVVCIVLVLMGIAGYWFIRRNKWL